MNQTDYLHFAAGILKAQRQAIIDGVPYQGESLHDLDMWDIDALLDPPPPSTRALTEDEDCRASVFGDGRHVWATDQDGPFCVNCCLSRRWIEEQRRRVADLMAAIKAVA